jgi:hypothetical protein
MLPGKGFPKKTIQERLESRKEALEKLLARSKQKQPSPKPQKKPRAQPAPAASEESTSSAAPIVPAVELVSLVPPRLGTSDGTGKRYLTPWGQKLAIKLLECARDRRISLCLVWPAEIDTVAPLHAITSLGAVLDSSLKGLRTLFYPGTDTTWATLDRITTDRSQYDELCKGFYNDVVPKTDADSVRAVLTACHEANYARNIPLLRIRQLIPAFRYDRTTENWVGVRQLPIDALIKRLPKAAMKEQLRARIDPVWTDATEAPGALLVLHREITKKGIKSALAGGRAGKRIPIDVVLMDASTRAILADPQSVKAIPKHIATIQEAAGHKTGVLLVTNDPAEYASLAKNLEKAGFKIETEILAAEATGTDWLAAGRELDSTWVPTTRDMVNFKVRATDEQAARLARQIRRIADTVRPEGPEVEEPFIRAQHLVQRASLLPGGIRDALADGADTGWSPLTAQLDLIRIAQDIQIVLSRGGATSQRKQIGEMIDKIRGHLEACNEATPLAEQLKDQIERHIILDRKAEMAIVIFSKRDIAIAQQYLARVLVDKWIAAKDRVQWLTLTEALTELTARASGKRLLIVGLNPRILRFLASQKEVPLHNSLLIPIYQAARMLPQLRFLSTVDALKAYRGRIVELKSRLEASLGDVPDIDALVRIYDTRLPAASRQSASGSPSDFSAYRLYLDDGRCVSVSGNIFRYEGLDDTKFHRVAVKEIREGDSVFEMSDELRDDVETVLATQFSGFQFSQFRTPLDGYRAMLNQAIESKFPGMDKADRIPALQMAMAALDKDGEEPPDYKLRYWLSAKTDPGDTAPRFPREKQEYLTFCKILFIPEALAEQFWLIIKKVRSDNQDVGRQMASLYTEVLLAPESSKIYRSIKPETIQMLQSKALDCVAQVVRIEPPQQGSGS